MVSGDESLGISTASHLKSTAISEEIIDVYRVEEEKTREHMKEILFFQIMLGTLGCLTKVE